MVAYIKPQQRKDKKGKGQEEREISSILLILVLKKKLTWIQLVRKDLIELNLTEEQAKVIAQNRNAWRNMIHRTMSKPLDGMC